MCVCVYTHTQTVLLLMLFLYQCCDLKLYFIKLYFIVVFNICLALIVWVSLEELIWGKSRVNLWEIGIVKYCLKYCFISPGEVFVLNDGGEVDLDLGNYERFLDINLYKDNNITTGKIYQHVINKERHGDYLGKTVQGAFIFRFMQIIVLSITILSSPSSTEGPDNHSILLLQQAVYGWLTGESVTCPVHRSDQGLAPKSLWTKEFGFNIYICIYIAKNIIIQYIYHLTDSERLDKALLTI